MDVIVDRLIWHVLPSVTHCMCFLVLFARTMYVYIYTYMNVIFMYIYTYMNVIIYCGARNCT